MLTVAQKREGLYYCVFGYLFCHCNINLTINDFTIAFLPNALGYGLFLLAIDILKEECEELELLRGFCKLLMVMSLSQFVERFLAEIPFIHLVYLVMLMVSIYFYFQFVTNLSTLVTSWGYAESGGQLLKFRTKLVVMSTIVQGSRLYAGVIPLRGLLEDVAPVILAVMSLFMFVYVLFIMAELWDVRRQLGEGTSLPLD